VRRVSEPPEGVLESAHLVDEAIEARLPFGELSIHEAAEYLLTAGGKRLRPAMLLLVAGSLGRDADEAVPAALGVEYVHSFTLIHDDIMDDDPLRRGRESVHERWDVPTAILTGDFLYSRSFGTLLETEGSPKTLRDATGVLAEASTCVCEGQALDIRLDETADATEEEYATMARNKTAVLFSASAGIGALLGDADEDAYDAATEYGRLVGEAFQIYDDLLDIEGSSDETGKPRASDLRENKSTIVTIHAHKRGVDTSLPEEADDEEVEAKIEEIRDAGSVDYARRRAESLVGEAKVRLNDLPETQERETLVRLADYLLERRY